MIKKLLIILLVSVTYLSHAQNKIVVFQSDFGVKDGAVSAMKGVATGVSSDLKLYDLTHESRRIIYGRRRIAFIKP